MASIPDWLQKRIREVARDTVEAHRFCDINNTRRCDLYHDLIQDTLALMAEAQEHLRRPMRCGHPLACLKDSSCVACRREADVARQARLVETGE